MGDPITAEEFSELYLATRAQVMGYLQRRAGGEGPDLMAEVYAIAWQRRADLPAPYLRRAWLFGTARRLLLVEHRRSMHEAAAIESLGQALKEPADSATPVDRSAVVRQVVAQMPEFDRELLMLSQWEEMTAVEIAVVVGIKPGTVRVRLHRARQILAADPRMQQLVAEATRVTSAPA